MAKILLLNSTSWPVVGGIETIMHHQAIALAAYGHDVTLLSGQGSPHDPKVHFHLIHELNPGFPLSLQAKRAVDHGQIDIHFHDLNKLLMEKLSPYFQKADLAIVHGGFTTHFNLALTQTLHQLADTTRTLAWAHDFTPCNKDYALPNPTKPPWNLMTRRHPRVTYVAVSEMRKNELCAHLKILSEEVPVIPNSIDFADLLEIDIEFWDWLSRKNWVDRDLVLYCPAKILQRKNLDLAIEMVQAIRSRLNLNALLFITGSADPNGAADSHYAEFLKSCITRHRLQDHVFFLQDHFPGKDFIWREAFRISDALLFPSRYEAFGLPLAEALTSGLECWCAELPAYDRWPSPLRRKVTTPDEAVAAAQAFAVEGAGRTKAAIRQQLNLFAVYENHLDPLLKKTLAS